MKKLVLGLIIVSLFMIGAVSYAHGPGMPGSGMMGGQDMGPGMMGSGQQGWNYCPYCGQNIRQGGYGMMGPGMMHGGYGMGPGMMGPGYYGQGVDCQKFFDETSDLRKDFHNKKFEYMETIRNPKADPESVTKLQNELNEIRGKVLSKAPQGCFVQ